VSSTWRDESDQSAAKAARRRLRRRASVRRVSLALPAFVMSVLGGAFAVWFLIGAPASSSPPGQASAGSALRAPVQPPQIAAAPAMADSRPAPPTPPPAPETTIQPEAAQSDTGSSILPMALQSTRQIVTPAQMMAVLNEPEQISAPRLAAPTPAERRPPAAPAPQATPLAQARVQPPAPAPKNEVKASLQGEATEEEPPAEPDKPARTSFSVVLARAETEGEARAKLGPLKQKFGSLLGARRLSYHRVKEGGAFIWRVRSAGLNEAQANEICEQIESAGGECSPAAQ